ncbi:MAG TPA: ABC transporter substrate-binding protein [Desulfobacteraceae bacterium]|nr:ABC transporter substrate-binding protein [Desulfobacteraceae bacterium]
MKKFPKVELSKDGSSKVTLTRRGVNKMKKEKLFFLAVMVTVAGFISGLVAVPGVLAKEKIKIGGIVDLTGPTNVIGVPFADGAADYFDKINKEGGINGRLIDYFPIDYQYKLPQAMAAYKRLVSQQNVIAVVGWGTGDCKARIPLVNRDKTVQFTGGFALDQTEPFTPYNFCHMISYMHQVIGMLEYAKAHPKEKGRKVRVAFVYSDAEYGRAPVRNIKKRNIVDEMGFELVDNEIISQRATEAVSQALTLKKAKPDYTVVILTSKPASVFLKDAKKVGVDTTFMGFSFLGDYGLLKLLGDVAKGLMVAAPCSYGHENNVPGIQKIWDYNKKYHPDRKVIELQYVYGWLYGMVMEEGLKRAGDNITGEGLKNALETITDFKTGGIAPPLTFSSKDHRGSYKLKLSIAKPEKGTFESFTDWIEVAK